MPEYVSFKLLEKARKFQIKAFMIFYFSFERYECKRVSAVLASTTITGGGVFGAHNKEVSVM